MPTLLGKKVENCKVNVRVRLTNSFRSPTNSSEKVPLLLMRAGTTFSSVAIHKLTISITNFREGTNRIESFGICFVKQSL
ncbi:hypothetical protein DICVIV_05816 [Dictyocaulus viviparus]|uniref:Uncharacterized protein n=1 Tax=Dictyocaulus viviparus TaxID=29172 RepID=A0A0D8XUA5_DICVI|nr:hypothetical protein DICVIV_05816 [Dictyocaulus viviparus]